MRDAGWDAGGEGGWERGGEGDGEGGGGKEVRKPMRKDVDGGGRGGV